MKNLIVFLGVSLCLTSCIVGGGPYVVDGVIVGNTKGPYIVTTNANVTKKGEACAMNLLGLFSWGDNSTEAALRDGHIKNVARVDFERFSVLGLFAKVCTIARGD